MDINDTIQMFREAQSRILSENPTPTTITDVMRLNDVVEEEVWKTLLEKEKERSTQLT